MDFKVLKVSNLSLDDNQTIHYTNAKNEKKKLEIVTPLLHLPFGIDKDTKMNYYLNLQLRKTNCNNHNHELFLFLKFLESIESFIKTETGKEVQSVIRKTPKYDTIINTKVLKNYNKLITETFKGPENFNFFNLKSGMNLKAQLIIDKIWEYNDKIFYKLKIQKLFLESV